MIKFSFEFFLKDNNIYSLFNEYRKKILKPYLITLTYNEFYVNKNFIKYLIKNNENIIFHIILNYNIKYFKNLVNFYFVNNLKKFLILKGDQKKINSFYYSCNLLNTIKKNYKRFKIYLSLYNEFHPNSLFYKNDIKNILYKINLLKNNTFISQYFYNFDSLIYFFDDIRKIYKNIKIIPGIMFLKSVNQLIKFSNICKSEIPVWLNKRINFKNFAFKNIKYFNKDLIINLIIKLNNFNINNIHIYTMNNISLANNILENLLNNLNI